MRFCKIHSRTYNTHLDRWFEVHPRVLASFCNMLTMVESVCDECTETKHNIPFILKPELYVQESQYPIDNSPY